MLKSLAVGKLPVCRNVPMVLRAVGSQLLLTGLEQILNSRNRRRRTVILLGLVFGVSRIGPGTIGGVVLVRVKGIVFTVIVGTWVLIGRANLGIAFNSFRKIIVLKPPTAGFSSFTFK